MSSSREIENTPGCIQQALNVIGDKWTPLILRDLHEAPCRFGELEKSLVGISPRTLSARLDRLEAEGILDKIVYCANPPRYQYQLTEKGRDLSRVLREMAKWGEKYGVSQPVRH